MAIFTTTDRDNVKAAMVALAVDGFASVTIGGQTTTVKSLDELRRLFDMIQQDLATAVPRHGLRMVKTVPPGAG